MYPRLVRLFYANLETRMGANGVYLESLVKSVPSTINCSVLETIFGQKFTYFHWVLSFIKKWEIVSFLKEFFIYFDEKQKEINQLTYLSYYICIVLILQW